MMQLFLLLCSLKNVQELEILKLGNSTINEIPEIPDEFKLFSRLRHFSLIRSMTVGGPNNFKSPSFSKICSLKTLEELDLSKNKIDVIPKEIGNLKNLEILKLDENPIREISEEIKSLSRLRHLSIESNSLDHLPSTFQDLKSLEHLCLSNTSLLIERMDQKENFLVIPLFPRFKIFPKEICQLENLKHLDIRQWIIPSLPSELSKLNRLEFFALQGLGQIDDFDTHKLCSPLIHQGHESIINYLKSLSSS